MKHLEKTGVCADETKITGTIYMLDINSSYKKPPKEEVYFNYLRGQYKALLEKYPDLKVNLIESDISSFQDFYIEPRDSVELDMAPVIAWWLKNKR